jgi:hypothetical protein
MNCQMFSTGLSAGDFGGSGKSVIVVGDGKPLRDMPSRLIKNKDGVRAGRDRKRDFSQMQRHGLAVAGGEDEPSAFSFGRADGAENIGRTRPLVVRRRRPCPAFPSHIEPTPPRPGIQLGGLPSTMRTPLW